MLYMGAVATERGPQGQGAGLEGVHAVYGHSGCSSSPGAAVGAMIGKSCFHTNTNAFGSNCT